MQVEAIASLLINDEKKEPGSFQWCPVTGQETMGINRNTGGSI